MSTNEPGSGSSDAPDGEHPIEEALFTDRPEPWVLRHLEQCVDCRIKLREHRLEQARPTSVNDALQAALPPKVRVAPRFQRKIWRGGFGDLGHTYRVRDPKRGFEELRLCVLSALDDVAAAQARIKRFVGVDTPGLVRILEVVDEPRHLVYLTELVDGEGLDRTELIGWGLLEVLRSVASALSTLHDHGLVHGNVGLASIQLIDGRATLADPMPELADQYSALDDWVALGTTLTQKGIHPDGPLGELVTDLAGGQLETSSAVLRRIVGLLGVGGAPNYRHRGWLGAGTTGAVARVTDLDLDRDVAMKVLNEQRLDPDGRSRFDRETRVTARLQHPGIAPLYARGVTLDGRPYFTMLVIEGQPMNERLREVHPVSGRERFPLRRLISLFAKAVEAVAFAHSKGIINRDLKTSHFIIGDYGEVFVQDWGHAKDLNRSAIPPRSGNGEPSVGATLDDTIIGTPGFLPPEQNGGDPSMHCRASDVYALGACLFHILTGAIPAPLDGDSNLAVRDRTSQNPLDAPHIPPDLAGLCRRAMAREIAVRHDDATEFLKDLQAWFEGDERKDQAMRRLVGLDDLRRSSDAARFHARTNLKLARDQLLEIPASAHAEAKSDPWRLQDEAEQLLHQAEALDAKYLRGLRSALEIDPQLTRARDAIASFFVERLRDAERQGDHRSAERFEALLREEGKASLVNGTGRLTLVTNPPGCHVTLCKWVRRQRRLVAEPLVGLGRTPLVDVEVSMGNWLLEIRRDENSEVVRYPIHIARDEHWDGVRPGESDPYPIWIPARGQLAEGERYVPAGRFYAGGDPDAADSHERRSIWCDGFVMTEHPIINRQFIEFLNDLVTRGDVDQAIAAQPRNEITEEPIYARRHGRFDYSTLSDPVHETLADAPVVFIDWHAAEAFGRWFGERTDRPWGLPHDLEWEKAARGTDGRHYPWGDFLDPSFACMVASHRSVPRRATVDMYPTDVSPYGIHGLGGNVRDWCANLYHRNGLDPDSERVERSNWPYTNANVRMARGGGWTSTASPYCRAASRFGDRPDVRHASLGFRLRWYVPDSNFG